MVDKAQFRTCPGLGLFRVEFGADCGRCRSRDDALDDAGVDSRDPCLMVD
jgi:hypothetical protein